MAADLQANSDDALSTLHAFVKRVLQRAAWIAQHADGPRPENELLVGEAVLRHAAVGDAPRVRHVAVLGPTQAGKSTIVNRIVGGAAADVSPLAGYTVHARGVCVGVPPDAVDLGPLFPGAACVAGRAEREARDTYELVAAPAREGERRPAPTTSVRKPVEPGAEDPDGRTAEQAEARGAAQGTLFDLDDDTARRKPERTSEEAGSPDPPAEAVVEPINRDAARPAPQAGAPLPANLVVWDTPDFDSLAAEGYVGSVLEVLAAADVHVVVVSKDKYADRTVWDVLELLAPLERPLFVVVNKLPAQEGARIVEALRARLDALEAVAGRYALRTFAYVPGGGTDADDTGLACDVAAALSGDTSNRDAGARRFAERNWDAWVAPVRRELAAADAWAARVDAALEDAVAEYQREYLHHPQRFDTFRRAIAELLALLELPGVGGVLTHVRSVLSWPARQVWNLRQRWSARGGKQEIDFARAGGNEQDVLTQIMSRTLVELERTANQNARESEASAYWEAVARGLAQRESHLREVFAAGAQRHHEEFAPHVRQAAETLFKRLQERPAVLNTLRGTRATLDAAGIMLAIKTGGLSPNDLLFAPAMFGLTSMLTEGALGSYMQTVAGDLRRKQLEHAQTRFFDAVARTELVALPRAGGGTAPIYGIERATLAEAEAALRNWGAKA